MISPFEENSSDIKYKVMWLLKNTCKKYDELETPFSRINKILYRSFMQIVLKIYNIKSDFFHRCTLYYKYSFNFFRVLSNFSLLQFYRNWFLCLVRWDYIYKLSISPIELWKIFYVFKLWESLCQRN